MLNLPRLSIKRHLSYSLYWFPISYLWASLNAIILPHFVAHMVDNSVKGTALGLIAGVGLLAAIFVQPMAGAVSDASAFRWGRRRPFIVAGASLSLLFLALLGFASSYAMLFLAYLGLQIASNVAHGPYQGLIPDLVPEYERGRASGFMGAMQVAGTGAVFLLYAFFIHPSQIALAVGSIMLVILVGMLLTVRLVPDRPAPVKVKMDPLAAVRRTFDRELVRYPDFLWLLVSRFFILLALDSIRDFALFYLRDVLGVANPVQAAGRLMIWILAGSLIGVLPAGFLSDRIGRKRLVFTSAAIGAFGAALFLTSNSYNEILAYGVIVGLAMGSFLSVDWAYATDLIPKSQAGRFLGISNIATAGASASSFLFGGPVIDVFNGRGENLGYHALLVLVVAYFAIGTLALLRVREVVAVDDPASQVAIAEDASLTRP